jgi:hypothetical protein
MTDQRALVFAILFAASPAWGDTHRPVAVSPGHTSRLELVESRCPTFSWGQVAGTEIYELVVYRTDRDQEEAPVALRTAIDGRAGSWTPTLRRCLERGGRYAWSLRARRAKTASRWSVPALFQIATGPGPAESDEALAVAHDRSPAAPWREPGADSSGSSQPRTRAATTRGPRTAGKDRNAPDISGAPSATAFSVEGGIEAASFSGDGSGLANVDAAGLSCVECVASGQLQNGAVTVAKIGAVCASGQVLMKGPTGWACATLAAPACTPGDEVACYTGAAGTRGIGECLGGTRICAADSTWGSCSGEITPAAGEVCDGLDNTCDGPVDEGDPATLCPLTANVASTLCDAAACSVVSCDALWADADGDYANGCEVPAPGSCLDGGAPRPIVAPAEGDLVIQEILADPASPLADADAEWFEVAVKSDVDLNGLGIGTTFGTVIDQLSAIDCLAVQDGDLLLFARSADPTANGNLATYQTFSFSLVNGGGSLHLAHDGNLVDSISWSAGDTASGQARDLPASLQDATANDDQSNWCNVGTDAALLYAAGNYGTPGQENVICP